ncbi:MAG: hypothetical protein AAF570_19895, partial [Bacteroidota bacterium]
MKPKQPIFILGLLCLLLPAWITAQTPNFSSSGTAFAFSYLQNRLLWNGNYPNVNHGTISLRFYVSNSSGTTANIT